VEDELSLCTIAWDDEAGVFYIVDSPIKGLRVEAKTPVEMIAAIARALEDLLG
jgi:hypothetical protein